jgi:hypothetical protein
MQPVHHDLCDNHHSGARWRPRARLPTLQVHLHHQCPLIIVEVGEGGVDDCHRRLLNDVLDHNIAVGAPMAWMT